MKLVMTVLVRDEEDIIVANLMHHLEAGVDHVYVMDNLSVDRTRDLLAPFEESGTVTVIEERSDDYSQSAWVTRMARRAHAEGADWVINSDADEFWWPSRAESLRAVFEAVPPEVGIVVVRRSDFPSIEPVTDEPFWERMTLRKLNSLNALGRSRLPKVAHRAVEGVSVAQGNHAVEGLDSYDVLSFAGLEILHFPIRSEAQFTSKIVNGGRAYERNKCLGPEVGSTWRHLYVEHLNGRLGEIYLEESVLDSQAEILISKGTLIRDTRLRERMRELGTAVLVQGGW